MYVSLNLSISVIINEKLIHQTKQSPDKISVRGSHNSEKKNKAIPVIVTHRSSRDMSHVMVTGSESRDILSGD